MYILLCSNNKYYTGSTRDLKKRVAEHEEGTGSNYTAKHLPVKLVYFEEFGRIDHAFEREKQIQNWSQRKKEALINGKLDELKKYSRKNEEFSSKGKRYL
jgi:putative endonuclease